MYYIYEIPGVKIGCTRKDQFNKRQGKQKDKGQMIILEQHEDIMIASTREQQLQKEKGYRVDHIPYWKAIQTGTHESCSKGGKKGGPIAGHISKPNLTFDQMSKGGKKGIEKMTFEQRSVGGKKSGPISGKLVAHRHHTCPHCGKEGKSNAMLQWHFNNCKEKS